MRRIKDWIGALICISIALRVAFYFCAKAYLDGRFEPFDWVAIPIGLAAGYIGYMYLRRIFGRQHVAV